MKSFISNLFGTKSKPLNAESIYEKIEFYSELLLKSDIKIISDKKWREVSGSSIRIFDTLQDMYIFEREILCLAGLIIRLKGFKENIKLLNEVIGLIEYKYTSGRNILIKAEILKIASSVHDFILDRMEFYLDEILSYLELKNPMAGIILYYQYFPLAKVESPKINYNEPSKSEGIILDAYLEMSFKELTLPILVKELPNTIIKYA